MLGIWAKSDLVPELQVRKVGGEISSLGVELEDYAFVTIGACQELLRWLCQYVPAMPRYMCFGKREWAWYQAQENIQCKR